MTRVKIEHTGPSFRIEITEHTDNIVCAGVSAISYMIAGWMINHQEDIDGMNLTMEYGYLDAGYLSAGEKTRAVMEAAVIALLQIQMGYPDDIRIEEYSVETL